MYINAYIARNERGLTLVELIISLVIISVAVIGILQVLNLTTRRSADPQMRKQALAIAEALLEEVQLAQFTFCDPTDTKVADASSPTDCLSKPEKVGQESGNTRPFDNVNDYVSQFRVAEPSFNNTSGTLIDAAGSPIQATGAYSATLMLTPEQLGPSNPPGLLITSAEGAGTPAETAAVNVIRITVTVSYGTDSIVLEGYRTRYDPHFVP